MKQNQKPCTKTKKVINRRKSKTLSKVKPVENISKNLLSFLESFILEFFYCKVMLLANVSWPT